MTKNAKLKRQVRALAEKEGLSYTAALRRIDEEERDTGRPGQMDGEGREEESRADVPAGEAPTKAPRG